MWKEDIMTGEGSTTKNVFWHYNIHRQFTGDEKILVRLVMDKQAQLYDK